MKIKLSKSQWQFIGKRAGWMKISQVEDKKVCQRCHGERFINTKLKNVGTSELVDHIIACPMCSGKGYTDKKDHESYLHSMGVGPCPHCDAKKDGL